MLTPEQEARFWSYVEKTEGCWLWTAGKHSFGYGVFSIRLSRARVKHHNAHRLAWQLTRGEVPKGMSVLHHCDNPPCLNPDHLYIGTQADNMADKKRRGRAASGDRNGNSKLTWEQVRAIRQALTEGKTPTFLAQKFNVHRDLIYLIRRHRIWVEKEN